MVYPTSNSVKQYRGCFKVDKLWGKNASFCLGRLECVLFDKFGGVIRTSTHSQQALNGARDEFPIPLYIISV